MRKFRLFGILTILILLFSACSPPGAVSDNIENTAEPGEVSSPTVEVISTDLPVPVITETPIQPAEPNSPPAINYPSPAAGTIALDFVDQICTAQWSSSINFFDCPGVPGSDNSISRLDNPILANGAEINLPSLLAVPVQYNGVFGRYPTFFVYPGDELRALVACKEPSTECSVEFSIEYYKNGEFFGYPNAVFQEPLSIGVEGSRELIVPLNALAGESVQFLLSVREKGTHDSVQALWIAPYIYRDPNATPISPVATNIPAQNPTPTENSEDTTPGVVSGWVDFTSAPGGVTNGQAMTIMFFNQEDSTWWWVQTGTANPYFQMTMPPGPYVVTAYTSVSGGSTTVGYTGGGQTCGAGLAVVNLDPNGQSTNIAITDWCNPGYWPAKPAAVPFP